MSATTQNSVIKSTELENIMSYCYGTENYYKIPQYSFKYTDGAKTFCEKADAYWLLDISCRHLFSLTIYYSQEYQYNFNVFNHNPQMLSNAVESLKV